MVFSSLQFLCVFLPITFILHLIIPSVKIKNFILLITSLIFYAYGEPVYVLLMIASAFFNYICGLLVAKEKISKASIILAVVVNLALLGVFKYSGFLVQSVNELFSVGLPVPQIELPIGISFFTFQALSYVIDVYRKQVDSQRNFFDLLLYITFFPQLIAGPIVKYRDVNDQIAYRTQDAQKIAEGLRRFVFGLSKKVLVANTMGQVADAIFAVEGDYLSVFTTWLGAIAYLLHIYYDFSGYSDMAIGLGKMFGFDFKENFDYPYSATCIKDFWRRWHISLSTWFKEYLYIPLGGNRKGKVRAVLNRLIVFFCTGLWHGASWTFVLWGLFHGFFMLLEEFIPKLRKLPKGIANIYTLVVVTVGFVLFKAETISYGFTFIAKMFTGFNITDASVSLGVSQLTPWFIVMLAVAIIGAVPVKVKAEEYIEKAAVKPAVKSAVQVVVYIITILLLAWCMLRLSSTSYNPFIYFRF